MLKFKIFTALMFISVLSCGIAGDNESSSDKVVQTETDHIAPAMKILSLIKGIAPRGEELHPRDLYAIGQVLVRDNGDLKGFRTGETSEWTKIYGSRVTGIGGNLYEVHIKLKNDEGNLYDFPFYTDTRIF